MLSLPLWGVYKHLGGFIHTNLGGEGLFFIFIYFFFTVQVIKTGKGFCVFLIGEEISEDPKLQLY